MLRAHKFRLYPKEKKEAVLDDSLRETRFIYNKLLEYRINKYEEEGTSVNKYSMSQRVVSAKQGALSVRCGQLMCKAL